MEKLIIELGTAFIGSLGFALMFHVRRVFWIPGALGGMLSWGIYLLGTSQTEGVFIPCLLASAFAALYAEVLARILKAPATIFFIPSVVPLIPGSTLYYTMSYAVQGAWDTSGTYGFLTVQYALSIASGISLVWAFSMMLSNKNFKNRLD